MGKENTWMKDCFHFLNGTNTINQEKGFTRLSFSKEERQAHKRFQTLAKGLGMEVTEDAVGNQWARLLVEEGAKTLAFGSHLDTVRGAGAFDGVTGLVAALTLVHHLKRKGIRPACNIVIIAFIAEESARFGLSTIGSKTIVGDLDKEKWAQLYDDQGISVKEAMEAAGINWDHFHQAYDTAFPIDEFLELHIEQGSRLDRANIPIGIVTGIATPLRLKLTIRGQANHSGTTMMTERKDALVAAAKIIGKVESLAKEFDKHQSGELVATVSTIRAYPNEINVIPGRVELGLDLRSIHDDLKEKFAESLKLYLEELSLEKGVRIEVSPLVKEKAVLLDQSIQERLAACCENLGFPYLFMPSGAGHDAMNMAKRWKTGMIFLPSVGGISHHPKEYTPFRYIEKGVSLLEEYVLRWKDEGQ